MSLRDRTFRSMLGLSAQPPSGHRPSTYKDYMEDNLCRAYEAVKYDGMSIRRAADEYHVPKSTLSDRLTGKVKFGSHSGPERYLTDMEEEELVSFLCASSKMGYAKTKKEVMAIVQNAVSSKGRQVSISNGWWEAFIKRYPFLTLRTAEKLSYARSIAGNTDVINNYFDLLEQTLVDNKLMDKPSHGQAIMDKPYH